MPEKSRNTRQKSLVLDALRQTGGRHVTAGGLYALLEQNGTPVPHSTLYRCLSALETGGLVRRYALPDSPSACYQALENADVCRAHYHLLCRLCGGLVHFESLPLTDSLNALCETEGLTVDMEKTVFHGACQACARKGGNTP